MKQEFFKTIERSKLIGKLKKLNTIGFEEIETKNSLGRILFEDVVSNENLPLCNRSSMDGYAVKAQNTFGASSSLPSYLECIGKIAVNAFPSQKLKDSECMEIPTGGSLPDGANGVVMVEHTKQMGSSTVEIHKSISPNENVMLEGEDVKKGRATLKKGTKLRAQEIGMLLALGISKCLVYKKIKCGIISTGDELVPVESKAKKGEIRDINSYTLSCLMEEAGAVFTRYGIIKDNFATLKSAIEKAMDENDTVFVSGGSSVGAYDFTISAVKSFQNTKILSYGLSLSPGKPTITAVIKDKLVVGLPGQVASALVVMKIIFVPALKFLMGNSKAFEDEPSIKATLSRNIASKQGREDFVRVFVSMKKDKILAEPVTAKSGLLTSLVNSNGLIKIPSNCEGFYKDEIVDVMRW